MRPEVVCPLRPLLDDLVVVDLADVVADLADKRLVIAAGGALELLPERVTLSLVPSSLGDRATLELVEASTATAPTWSASITPSTSPANRRVVIIFFFIVVLLVGTYDLIQIYLFHVVYMCFALPPSPPTLAPLIVTSFDGTNDGWKIS